MIGLSPRDESALFDTPVVSFIALNNGSITPLIAADPDRVYLLITACVGSSIYVAPKGNAANQRGFPIGIGVPFMMVFDYVNTGPLTGLGWDAFVAAAGAIVMVISTTLRRPPELAGFRDVFKGSAGTGIIPPVYQPALARRTARRVPLPSGVKRLLATRCPHLYSGDE